MFRFMLTDWLTVSVEFTSPHTMMVYSQAVGDTCSAQYWETCKQQQLFRGSL